MNTIDQLGMDIAGEMLLALTSEEKNTVQNKIPTDEMISYLKRNVNFLSVTDKKTVGDILIMNDMKNLLKSCSEGVIINLRLLNDTVLRQMYDLTMYKINKQTYI